MHSGDFPDRCLAAKTWLNFSGVAWGKAEIHHFYRACLAQCWGSAAQPGFLCSEGEPHTGLLSHWAVCSVLRAARNSISKEVTMQKPWEKLGGERKGKGGSKMNWLTNAAGESWHPLARLEEALGKRTKLESCKGMLCSEWGAIAWNFLPRYFWPWGGHLRFPPQDGLIGNVDVSLGTCWCITQTFSVEKKTLS